METESVSRVTSLIASALGLPPGSVTEEDTIDKFPEWDSLGHLNILTALEKRFGVQVVRIAGLAKATSVKTIITLLETHHVI